MALAAVMVLVMALAMFHAARAGRGAGRADRRAALSAAGRGAAGANARTRLCQRECGAREQRSRSGRDLQNFHWLSPLCFLSAKTTRGLKRAMTKRSGTQ